MRVVHVVQSLALGGQEMLIVQLSRELLRRGHEVGVVALSPGGELSGELRALGARVNELGRREGFDPRLFGALGVALGRWRPAVVHTHNASPLIYGAPVARLLGARVVHTKHGVGETSARTRLLLRATARLPAAWVCVSEETAQLAVAREGAPSVRTVVLRNGVDVAAFAPSAARRRAARALLPVEHDAFVVGTVGRMVPAKDHATLVEAVALVPGAHLVLVGDGPERPRVEALARARLPRCVHLLGARRDVSHLLHAFDVFALSSRTEGVPLALLEAMAAERAVVATAVGGVPSVLAEVGALAPAGNAAALAAAIDAYRNDGPAREDAGRAARRRVADRYSLSAMTDAYEALYRGDPSGAGVA